MKILIYGINYAPELTGIGKYSGEMGAWLAQQHHEVDVITAHPYYPQWRVSAEHKRKGWFSERLQGVRVSRSPLYVPRHVTALRRMLHEFSFVAGSLPHWFRAFFRRRYDVVICVVPAFHLGFPALLYARLRKATFIYHVQDLQVDAAKDLGMIRNRTFLSLLLKAEKYLLDSCTTVSTISEGMLRKIRAKGIPEKKCLLFPNWVDAQHVRPLAPGQSLRAEFGLSETDQVVLYSGNLGEKQGLELVIDVAQQLRHRPNLYFLIVGAGGARQRLEEQAHDYGLTNVKFFPLQPYEKLSALLATADLHLVLQKKSASDLVMPSKLTGILAAGGCALVTAVPGTSLYDVVQQHGLGLLVEPESADALRTGIETALAGDLSPYRVNARSYAERYLSKDSVLKAFEQKLVRLTNPLPARPEFAQPEPVLT